MAHEGRREDRGVGMGFLCENLREDPERKTHAWGERKQGLKVDPAGEQAEEMLQKQSGQD